MFGGLVGALVPQSCSGGLLQDVPDEGSLFHVSPISPGFFMHPSGAASPHPQTGVLLPTTLDDFSDSVLGDPITYAQCERIPWSDTPITLPVYTLLSGLAYMPGQSSVQTVLALGTSSGPEVWSSAIASPMDTEDSPLLTTGLPGCLYWFTLHTRPAFSDVNPAFGLQLHHPRFLEFVGAPESARLLYHSPTFWVDQLGEELAIAAAVNLQRDAGIMLFNLQILSQFVTSLHRMTSEMMYIGMGQAVFPAEEVANLSTAPRTTLAAMYMTAMGLWRPRTGPGDPGPVPASSCSTSE